MKKVKVSDMSSPYEPSEDSHLLAGCIKDYARGKCLDVGTGSGIQAGTARKYCDDCTGVDIDPDAIEYCLKNHKGVNFFVSDLFSKVEGKFDLITFNAPYLPQDPEDIEDIQIYGGKEGHETTERFLVDAKDHLADDGVILLLISSFTTKEKIEEVLKREGYKFKIITKQHISFEDLLVYEITR